MALNKITLFEDLLYKYHNFLFTYGWTHGLFQFRANINKAAVNISVHVFVWTNALISLG